MVVFLQYDSMGTINRHALWLSNDIIHRFHLLNNYALNLNLIAKLHKAGW